MTTEYCTHNDCRCHTAEELAYMSESLARPELLHAAIMCFQLSVRCRHVPHKGSPQAPLPGDNT